MPRQIFLSYAREDAAVVAEMAADLRALDHEVWLDQDLGGGQDWWDEILARIRWCDAFLPVLSAAALRSRACTSERVYGVALDRPVLPVAVGDLGPEGLLDEDLARRQRISYRPGNKPSTLRLLAAVHRLAPAPPLSDIGPTPPPAPMAYFGALRAELDGSASIDFDRQLVLLGRLSAEAEDTDQHPEIATLVHIFLARREIAAYVQRQLIVLQRGLGGSGTSVVPSLSDSARRARIAGVLAKPKAPPERARRAGLQAASSVNGKEVRKLIVACDAGMGSSVMLASQMRKKLKPYNVEVEHSPVNSIPADAQVVLTQGELAERARRAAPNAVVVPFKQFMGDPAFTRIENAIKDGGEIRG